MLGQPFLILTVLYSAQAVMLKFSIELLIIRTSIFAVCVVFEVNTNYNRKERSQNI